MSNKKYLGFMVPEIIVNLILLFYYIVSLVILGKYFLY